MQLSYLLFDTTDEESGACSFDAMASVLPDGLAPLLQEVEAVLGWAHREFGAPLEADDASEWNFDLHAVDAQEAPLPIGYDARSGGVSLAAPPGRVTLTLTVTGSAAFSAAFQHAFPGGD